MHKVLLDRGPKNFWGIVGQKAEGVFKRKSKVEDSIEEVTEEYFIESADIWTIISITDDAIEVEGYSKNKISYIRKQD